MQGFLFWPVLIAPLLFLRGCPPEGQILPRYTFAELDDWFFFPLSLFFAKEEEAIFGVCRMHVLKNVRFWHFLDASKRGAS